MIGIVLINIRMNQRQEWTLLHATFSGRCSLESPEMARASSSLPTGEIYTSLQA